MDNVAQLAKIEELRQTSGDMYAPTCAKYQSQFQRVTGRGKKYYDCGKPLMLLDCPNQSQGLLDGAEHTHKTVHRSCGRSECPICYKTWAKREGMRMATRHKLCEGAYHRDHQPLGFPKHIIFSPPQAWAVRLLNDDPVTAWGTLRKEAVHQAKLAGVRGGSVVFHAVRKDKATGEEYLSPHFHIIGYGWLMPSNEYHERSNGWVYSYIPGKRDVFATGSYELSHASILSNHHAVTYFGCMAYSKLKITVVDTRLELIRCQGCSAPLEVWLYDEEGILSDSLCKTKIYEKITEYEASIVGSDSGSHRARSDQSILDIL